MSVGSKLKSWWHVIAYHTASKLAFLGTRAFIRVRVTGREHLPRQGPYLLVCNHISHFDPPILASSICRKIAWVVALDMYAHPVGWAYFTAIESIPVDRQKTDRMVARAMLRRLQQGEIVGLFPEAGIRSGAASVLGGAPLDEAVGSLARLGRVPVVPVVILGADKLYVRKAWFWRTTVDLRFGPAVPWDMDGEHPEIEITQKARETMLRLAEDLKRKFGLTEKDLPKTAQERWGEG